jgi:hypothetical protein
MASGSPEHHMDRLGFRLGDRSCNFVLAAEEWLGTSMASGFTTAQTGRAHDRTRPMLQQRQKVLAKAAPSTHGPTRTSARISYGSRRIMKLSL